MRRLALTLAGLLVVLGPSARADEEPLPRRVGSSDPRERSSAVKEIRGDPTLAGIRLIFPLLDDKDAYVRDSTWSALATIKKPEWVRWIASAAKSSRNAWIRQQAADALGRGRQPAAIATLVAMLDDRDPEVRTEVAVALGKHKGSAEAYEALLARMKDKESFVRAAVYESLSRVDKDAAVPHLQAAVRSEEPGVRCVALRSLRYGNKDLAIEVGAWALFQGDWRLRAQAIENALWIRDRRVVEGLVAATERVKRRRVRADIFEALRRLTGLEIPPTTRDWQEWWTAHGSEWQSEGKIPEKVSDEPGQSSARYYGIPIRSGRVTFLLDASGSMRDDMGGTDARTKMQRAREELLRTLDQLDPATRFNLIVFSDRPKAFKPALVPLDKRHRRKVESFVGPINGAGKTNVYDALVLALADDDVDTVFLLSDGAPNVGRYLFRERILDHVRRINRSRKIVIHTIGFLGRERDRKFNRDLARQNGGVSVFPN